MSIRFTVTKNALFGRINRLLAKQSLRLRTNRPGGPAYDRLGRYYLLDTATKTIVEHHIPLEMYAKDLGGIECLGMSGGVTPSR